MHNRSNLTTPLNFYMAMVLVDTHAHLYLPQFADDIGNVVQNAIANHVVIMLLPNIDNRSVAPMLQLCSRFPMNLFPMIGLHPTSVNQNYRHELTRLESFLGVPGLKAIGETGMDAYWDTEFMSEQEDSFNKHLDWAKELELPVVIHSRKTTDDLINIISSRKQDGARGVFHAFSGSAEQAARIAELGFSLGIGGVVTYKNSGLRPVIETIDLDHIVLETDSPYLTPVPFRGKRNECANLVLIAEEIARIKGISIGEVARVTTENASRLFRLDISGLEGTAT
jgi:TatD DNase family protein